MLRVALIVVAVFLFASPAFAQCDVSGQIPGALRGPLCEISTSISGSGPPVNQLTLMVKREVATAVRAKTPDAEDLLLTILNSWMNLRSAKVARVEVYYGRAHLATAKTNVFRAPSVNYH